MYKSLTLPLLVTLFFHGVLLAFILIDAPEPTRIVKRAATKYIQAELVTLDKPKQVEKPKKAVKPVKKEKPKPDESKQIAEKKRQQEQLAKAEQQKKQQALEQQRIKEREQKRAKAEQMQRQTEQELADAIAEEEVRNQAFSDVEVANSFIALITEVIQNNWNRPPSARNSMEAELSLQLVPTGEVVSVKIIRSSGNAAFDRSAEAAVLKAGRFPELQKLPPRIFEQYFRRLRLKFRPEDLRL
ncbi:energy transducer TonB [Oceanicoccus sp. KOV_DT_Chl]|uniref:energy transducer TonB n=1 Tax=Oceanicoccus sp. KOV_DT_Chl TaxID=1904639 RepID=UPI000C7B99B1|nr:energy transducer TonB [Oceanicoccus sp. KOV_DT_Chl]